jgi:hypothetical protein
MIALTWTAAPAPEKDSAGSLVLAIIEALDSVREGSIDDESHALVANKIVRRRLDKRAITYQEYKAWRKRNPLVFTTIVSSTNDLIGFFDIFPLNASAAEGLLSGTLAERALKADQILCSTESRHAIHLHIATILVNPNQRYNSGGLLLEY